MKIFYAIQATGNGHISRAIQLYPYLQKFGEVDFFLSGSNASLDFNLPIKYRNKGCSLHYSACGGLDYPAIVKNINPLTLYKDAKNLPLNQYDVIINDFESVTSLACKLQKKKSIQFGHQASFTSGKTPRPGKADFLGELVLKNYSKSTHNIGLHFRKYDSFIFEPVIKKKIIESTPTNKKHITVYLPSFDLECLERTFLSFPEVEFHWFLKTVKEPYRQGKISYYPINQELFDESLIHCEGIITGGGFETPAEALYLQKKVLAIPIANHYEQACNAEALKQLGVPVLKKVDANFTLEIENWLNSKIKYPEIKANNIPETLDVLFSL